MKFDERDVEYEAFRGKGPGGQRKNKVACCIRATHVPSGIVAVATSERSLFQNKAAALGNLRAKFAKAQEAREDAAMRARHHQKPEASFGAQIRTYRMVGNHQHVQDHRTQHQQPIDTTLRGNLDGFIRSFLRWRKTT